MKRVLLVSNNGQGFYNFKKELLEVLLTQGLEVHFSVPNYEKLVRLVNAGAFYHELKVDRRGMNPLKDLELILQLKNVYKEVNPDIMILHTIKPNIYGSCLAMWMGKPYMNNITGLGSALQEDNLLAKVIRKMYRFALKETKAVFFENVGNRDYFQKYEIAQEDKYIVVPGAGVNTSHYARQKNFPEYKSSGKNVCFLYIARVMKDKGIEEYLKAAEAVKKRYPEVRFQILGYYDEDRYKLKVEQMEADGILEYLGVSHDTRLQMSQADCIVLPSYHEGMSNVLLEGASFGLPLITSNVYGCKEAVEEGVTGFLCEPRDAKSLELALEKFLLLSEKERMEMGKLGRKKMIENFDRKIVMKQYLKCIESLIK